MGRDEQDPALKFLCERANAGEHYESGMVEQAR